MTNQTKIMVSAPGKLMLSGSYAVVHGWPAVVTAVNQRLKVTVEILDQPIFMLIAPDVNLFDYQKSLDQVGQGQIPKSAVFMEKIIADLVKKQQLKSGIKIVTNCSFSANFGFGSSSASVVALIFAVNELLNLKLSKLEMFKWCYQIIIDVQGVGSGFDIAAAIWGGTIYYIKPAKIVQSIKVNSLPIVVGYTGVKADTPTLVKKIDQRLLTEPKVIEPIFQQIGRISDQLKIALETANWPQLGKLFTQHQSAARKLGVSSDQLESLIAAANEAGAFGSTLSGAGGGDCMIAVASEDKKVVVEQAIEQAGGQVMSVNLNSDGVRKEKI